MSQNDMVRQLAVILGIKEEDARGLEVQEFIKPDGSVNAARVEHELRQQEAKAWGPI